MIKFQYNKTSLQGLDKQLKMRVRALPTIKNKESALRSEVKKAKQVADEFNVKLEEGRLAFVFQSIAEFIERHAATL